MLKVILTTALVSIVLFGAVGAFWYQQTEIAGLETQVVSLRSQVLIEHQAFVRNRKTLVEEDKALAVTQKREAQLEGVVRIIVDALNSTVAPEPDNNSKGN